MKMQVFTRRAIEDSSACCPRRVETGESANGQLTYIVSTLPTTQSETMSSHLDDPRDPGAEAPLTFPELWQKDSPGGSTNHYLTTSSVVANTLLMPRCTLRIRYVSIYAEFQECEVLRDSRPDSVMFISGVIMITRNRYVSIFLLDDEALIVGLDTSRGPLSCCPSTA